jgi:hypothetical protein
MEITQELREGSEKEMEGREEQWSENGPPAIGDVRKAIDRLKNNRLP